MRRRVPLIKRTIFPTLALILLTVSFAFAGSPIGVVELTSVDELAGAIAAYFPKVDGAVKAVDGDRLTFDLSRLDGLTPGMEMQIWREGKRITHPVTDEVIGRQEEEVGSLEVVSAGDEFSTGTIRKKLKAPKEGDRVRITPKEINLAIIPIQPDHPEIAQGLFERLSGYGRFAVVEMEKTAVFVKERKQRDTGLVREMGRELGVDAVVALSVFSCSDKALVAARVFYAGEEVRPLDTIIASIDIKTPPKNALGEAKPFFVPAAEEKAAAPELPVSARYLVSADFDKDGKIEYAFSDASKIYILRHEPGGWREVWTEMLHAESQGIQHFNIDTADINGNEKPELFVTSMLNGRVFSFVLEFTDGTYRRIADVPGFLRVLSYPGKKTVLIGQDYDPASFYKGDARIYTWTDGKYVPGSEFPLPKELSLYGFTTGRFEEGRTFLAGFDDDDHLIVYSGTSPIWKSAEQYPAVETLVHKPVTGIQAVVSRESGQKDKSLRVRIPGRILAMDINGDGRDELIVMKNTFGAFIGDFKEAEIAGLYWTGARFETSWNVKEIPGAVLDFQVVRQDHTGARVISLVRTKGGYFSRARQQVITYSIR